VTRAAVDRSPPNFASMVREKIGPPQCFRSGAALKGSIMIRDGIAQLSGTAATFSVAQLRGPGEDSVTFFVKLVRHEQDIVAQSMHSAACDASRTVNPACHDGYGVRQPSRQQ
jgi:hypothetical protein